MDKTQKAPSTKYTKVGKQIQRQSYKQLLLSPTANTNTQIDLYRVIHYSYRQPATTSWNLMGLIKLTQKDFSMGNSHPEETLRTLNFK